MTFHVILAAKAILLAASVVISYVFLHTKLKIKNAEMAKYISIKIEMY